MLEEFSSWIVLSILNIEKGTRLESTLNFFIYDSIKILLLLFVMITIVGYIRTYISEQKIRQLLSGKRQGIGNIIAAIMGAITPFCSCSSIPVFLSFMKAKIPLGVSFSFLVTSPLVNEYVAIIMLGFFGWKITALYIISGILIGVFSGIVIGKLGLERHIVQDLIKTDDNPNEKIFNTQQERINTGLKEAVAIIKSIWLWVFVGIGIAAGIHGYIPEDTVMNLIQTGGIFAVPIATLIGVPLYANCAAVVPIAVVLFEKGFPLGTALAFMMGTAALSIPEAIILRRAMRLPLIIAFFTIVTIAIILTGYAFNILATLLI
ncbi:MAG: permease [Candidatus Aenigmarchaeota archaeon]|nr:permease [Candidatus Aenigmarchaeota archaeon]